MELTSSWGHIVQRYRIKPMHVVWSSAWILSIPLRTTRDLEYSMEESGQKVLGHGMHRSRMSVVQAPRGCLWRARMLIPALDDLQPLIRRAATRVLGAANACLYSGIKHSNSFRHSGFDQHSSWIRIRIPTIRLPLMIHICELTLKENIFP